MTSKVIVPVSDFAALITRIEALENELTARKEREAKRYNHGPCLRCGYGPWESFRASQPKCCPRCHSAYWDTEPRHRSARTPEDPPNPKWTSGPKPGPRDRAAARASTTVVEAPLQSNTGFTRPLVILPPELRPPGEPLIPPPPLPDVVAARTVDNPMNVKPVATSLSEQLAERVTPVVHTAPMPDSIVAEIMAGSPITYDDIKAAREGGDATITLGDGKPESDGTGVSNERGDAEGQLQDNGNQRPDPPVLAEKKAAFFAGYEVPEGAPVADETPFVKGTETPSLAPPPDDDPFWK